jgi:hypothetical protein
VDKYYNESGFDNHYDARFFRGELNRDSRVMVLGELLCTLSQMGREYGFKPILMHGSLLGWWWNRMVLPWDLDIDVCITLSELYRLVDVVSTREDHLWDVNPNFMERSTLNIHHTNDIEPNRIDARLIHKGTGVYIDITALLQSQPEVLCTKCPHYFYYYDIYPLRSTYLNGVEVSVPARVKTVLHEEYGSRCTEQEEFGGWRFDRAIRLWVPTDS